MVPSMKTLISDITGNVGAALARELVAAGWDVSGFGEGMPVEGATLLERPGDATELAELVRGIDVIFVLDLFSARPLSDRADAVQSLIAAAIAGECRRVVLLGSTEVYDHSAVASGALRETGPFCSPRDASDLALAAGRSEQALRPASGSVPEPVVLRAPSLYGPDVPSSFGRIRDVLRGRHADHGQARIQGVTVPHLAKALAAAGRIPAAAGHAYTVADSVAVAWPDFVEETRRLGRQLSDQAEPEDRARAEYPVRPLLYATDKAARMLGIGAGPAPWVPMAQMVQVITKDLVQENDFIPTVAPASAPLLAIQSGETPLAGKTAVVTGASSGLGRATALMLAQLGADVVGLGRNAEKGRSLIAEAKAGDVTGTIRFYAADLSRMSEVRKASADIAKQFPVIDILVNNAGGLFGTRILTADGLEMNFALNHLAPFLMTSLLRPNLLKSGAGKVITLTSEAHERASIDFDDLQSEAYEPMRAYGQSKLANILFTYSLAEKAKDTKVSVFALNPGAVSTDIGTRNEGLDAATWDQMTMTALPPKKAARYVADLILSPVYQGQTGLYVSKAEPTASAPQSYNAQVADRLWRVSEELTAPKADQTRASGF